MQIYDLILYNDIFLSLLWVWFLAIVELFKCFWILGMSGRLGLGLPVKLAVVLL